MSTHGFLLSWILLTAAAAAAATIEGDFYVARNGNDQWSGKLAEPNAAKTDGPFASVARAQQAARALRKAQADRPKPMVVLVRGGAYALAEPLTFTPDDSGTTTSPTVYAAYAQERPVLSGGVVLSGWKREADGRWTLTLPEVKGGTWDFTQLFVNGQRRYRPRLPQTGYYYIADRMDPTAKSAGKGSDRFKYAAEEIRPDWANLRDVEVLAFQTWTMARMRIESVDPPNRVVNFTGRTRSLESYSAFQKGNRFLVENVKEALSQAGQWYLDRPSGVLTYIPMPGEDPTSAEVIAPKTDALLRLKGNIEERKWVERVVFRGLTFGYANWVTPPEGNNYPQAEVNIDAAITASGARDCAFEQCSVTHVGGYAIEFAAACKRNRVEGCELTDLGAGGVKLGLTRIEPDEELLTSHQVVRDNLIAHGGRLHPAAIGVWVGHSPYNVMEHNDISDLYYTGISVGWSWGYAPCPSDHNTVAYNHIYNIGQGVLSDMGGIYTLGLAPGSVLHHNLIHDVHAFDYGGWGIYFDEGTTGMVAENNIVFRTKTGGFHQHYGKENIVRNNIFALTIKDQLQRSRMEPHLSFTFERNIVYWKPTGNLLGSNWTDDKYKMDYNLYWRTDGQPFDFAKMSLEKWRERGQDRNSIIADPMFVDPENGNFGLKPGSPGEKIGFKPIQLETPGRLPKVPPASGKPDLPPAFPLTPPE